MITAVLPIVFTSSFGMKTPNQTFEGFMCKVYGNQYAECEKQQQQQQQPSEKRFAVRSGAEDM